MSALADLREKARAGAVIALAVLSRGASIAGEVAGKASGALNELADKVNGKDDDGR